MSTTESAFRTALIGGFNRQDVLNYIEQSTRAANARIAKLEQEAQEAQQGRDAAEAALAEITAKEAALTQEAQQTGKDLTERAAAMSALQSQLEVLQAELTAAREELGASKEECAKLRQGAEAYAQLKDHTATIELEAHQRARAIEKEAADRAKKVRTEAEQILYKVQSGYGRLRSDVDATIAHAAGELGRVDKALEGVKAEFAVHDEELSKLLQSYRESVGCKAPEPLPLDEA